MWYDATSAAGSLEAPDSPVAGKIGYVAGAGRARPRAPAGSTPGRGPSRRPARSRTTPGSSSPGRPARSTRSWSARSSAGPGCPAGKRASTYANPDYLKEAAAFADADPGRDRGAPTRRTRACSRGRRSGIQFVDIPEFPDLGTQVSQDVSSAIAGQMSVRRGAGPRARSWPTDVAERSTPGDRPARRIPSARSGGPHDAPTRPSPAVPPAASARPGTARQLGTPARQLGAPRAAAARPDLHDRRHPAAVRRDPGHLVHELERLLPGRARLRRARQLPARSSPTPTLRSRGRSPRSC